MKFFTRRKKSDTSGNGEGKHVLPKHSSQKESFSVKKPAKIVIWILVGLMAAGGTVYYLNMPVDIETVTVNPTTAGEYFIEEGSVKDADAVNVYSTIPGVIVEKIAQEGDIVEAGDVLCVLDTAGTEDAIAMSHIAIEGYEAQKDNVGEQQEARISELNAAIAGMRSELRNVDAQERDYLAQVADETRLANDAIRRANDAIIQSNKEIKAQVKSQAARQQVIVDQAQDYYESVKGGDPVKEAEAKLALDRAKVELKIIKDGDDNLPKPSNDFLDVRAYTEYFASLKQSLRDRIAIMEKQTKEDYTESMRRYYDAVIAGEEIRIKSLEKSIEDSTIRSPVSGRIAELYIKDTNVVSTAAPIALIETGRSHDIEVFVTTRDYTDIYLGQTVEITQSASSGDIIFSGVVKEIGDEAQTRLSTLGITERVVKITIEPDENEDASLLPGFSFDVRFVTFSAGNQLLVPKTAVFKYSANRAASGIVWLGSDRGGQSVTDVDMVFDATSGKVVMREVKPGRELRSDYVIDAGLSPGSVVIKDSSDENIRVGMNVR